MNPILINSFFKLSVASENFALGKKLFEFEVYESESTALIGRIVAKIKRTTILRILK